MPSNPQGGPNGWASSQTPIKHVLLFGVVVFFFWASLSLYIPILPVYSQSLGASLPMVGVIVAAYGIPQLLLRLPAGILFDAINKRKRLLIAGILITSLGALGLGLAPNPWMLFVARAVSGIGAAAQIFFIAYFAAYYSPQSVQRPISIINSVFWVAMVAASYFGGWLAEVYGYKSTFFAAAVLAIIALIAVLFTRERVIPKTERVSWSRFKTVATYPPLLLIALLSILLTFVDFSTVFAFVPVYGATIGASSADLGVIIMLSLATAAVGALITVRLVKLWGIRFVIALSAILLGVTTVAVPWIQHISLLEVAMLFNGLGRGLSAAIAMSLSMQAVPPQQRATALGIAHTAFAVGMLAGPLISGLVAESWGLASVFYLSTFCCVVIGGIAYLPAVKRLESQ